MNNKVKMLLQFRGKKQQDLLDIWKVSSKQALTNKIRNERFDLSDIIKLCDYLDYEIVINDKKTGDPIVKFDISDIKGEK